MNYSLSTPVIVIVIVALAQELFALLIVLITSLLGVAVSATEMAVSLRANRINLASKIARMAGTNDFLT